MDTKVSEGGGAGGASGARVEIPLRLLHHPDTDCPPEISWRAMGEMLSALQAAEDSTQEQVMCPEGYCSLWKACQE